ncbi:MAG: class I SAM-dependent methyltransferase [Vicinamibacterales bacterium]
MTPSQELRQQFGEIDIYLFDQLLRGRFDGARRQRVLDAGCGEGRNLPFFVQHGFEVCAIDGDPCAVARAGGLLKGNGDVRQGVLEALPWDAGSIDVVICSAVLHFARDEDHFDAMTQELWRVLRPGGLFFARLASSIGIERFLDLTRGRVRLPDGSQRFVVDQQKIIDTTAALGGTLLDPIKTTNVQNQRAMTTWVAEKRPA